MKTYKKQQQQQQQHKFEVTKHREHQAEPLVTASSELVGPLSQANKMPKVFRSLQHLSFSVRHPPHPPNVCFISLPGEGVVGVGVGETS